LRMGAAEKAESYKAALEAIAGMSISDETDKSEALAICIAIARIEIAKA
jgi:hypothetical protein